MLDISRSVRRHWEYRNARTRKQEKQEKRDQQAVLDAMVSEKLRPGAITGRSAIRPRSVLALILQEACRLPQPFTTTQLARKVHRVNCNVSTRLYELEELGYVELIKNELTRTYEGTDAKTRRWLLHWRVK